MVHYAELEAIAAALTDHAVNDSVIAPEVAPIKVLG